MKKMTRTETRAETETQKGTKKAMATNYPMKETLKNLRIPRPATVGTLGDKNALLG